MAKVNLFNQVRDFVEKINEAGGKPLYELTPEEARGVLRGVQEAKTEEPDVERKEAEIEVCGWKLQSPRVLPENSALFTIFTEAAGLWAII